jgi:hypothetical protein
MIVAGFAVAVRLGRDLLAYATDVLRVLKAGATASGHND